MHLEALLFQVVSVKNIAFEFASWISPSFNAMLIRQGLSSFERISQLNAVAIMQMKSLIDSKQMKNWNRWTSQIINQTNSLLLLYKENLSN